MWWWFRIYRVADVHLIFTVSIQPDLPARIKKNITLTPYDRSKFYIPKVPEGYVDYTFADKESEENLKRVDKKL